MDERIKEVGFADEKTKEAYLKLKEGKFEEKQLFDFLNRAIDDLKNNPLCGIRIHSNLIPKEYVQNYGVNNLPNAWRVLYTLIGNEIKVISVILEWLDHKDYEKRFNY